MAALGFVVAPDYLPEHFGTWYMLNAYLQKETGQDIHLHMPVSASEEDRLIEADKADMIYANPFDAARLVRERGYLPLARPVEKYDEVVVAVAADSPFRTIEDLPAGISVAFPPDKNVRNIGLRLLESADLNEGNIRIEETDAFSKVTSGVLKERVQVGFFLADAYYRLSDLSRDNMHVLLESRIHDIYHVILLHPKHAALQQSLTNALLAMNQNPAGSKILASLDMAKGFEVLHQEDAEFMIDLTETLLN